MPPRLSTEELAACLGNGTAPSRHFDLYVGDSGALPAQIMATPTGSATKKPIVFAFHGAVARNDRVLPVFDGDLFRTTLEGKATLLSFADPSLALNDTLSAAWYTNTARREVADELRSVIASLIASLEPSRVVFFGPSVGGHAALYQSRFVDDSVCIAKNPITCIRRYFSKLVEDYRAAAWPDLPKAAALPASACDDVGAIYNNGFLNTVIYLQNTTDHHLPRQMLPFVAKTRNPSNFMLICKDCGKYTGHSYPPEELKAWISASTFTASRAPTDIAAAVNYILRRGSAQAWNAQREVKNIDDDISIAKALANYELNNSV